MIKIITLILFFTIAPAIYPQTSADSLYLKAYISDKEYFMKLQETVSSKNQYIGLQWCIDLLNKYIEFEQKKLNEISVKK